MRMKKLLLSLLAVVGLSFAASADEVIFDFVGDGTSDLYGMTRLSGTTSEYNPDPTTITDGAVSIKLTGNTRLWKDGLRFYTSSAMEISAPGYTVTGVKFGNNNYGSFNYNNKALTADTWTGNEESVKFSCNITKSNKAVNKLTITIEPATGVVKADAGLSFGETTEFNVNLGEAFTAPKLTKATTAEVIFETNNEAVATVDENTGAVEIKGVGTATITATAEANDEYNAGTASYTIKVVDPNSTAVDVTFDFVKNTYDLGSRGGSTYITEATATSEGVTLTFAKTGGNGFRLWSDGLRVYKTGSGNATIAVAAKNANITGIEMAVASNFTTVQIDGVTVESNNKTYSWNGNVKNPVITMTQTGGNYAITTLKVTYEEIEGGLKDAELAYKTINYTATLGDTFETPELQNPHNLDVTYTSSNPEVATVGADGALTLVGVGTTTITAKSEATAEFDAGSAYYILNVVKKYVTVDDFYAIGENNKGIIGFDLIVTFVNEGSIYAVTESGEATLVFMFNSGLKAGDVIPAGWEGQYAPFNGLPEIKPVSALPEVTETAAVPEPAEVTAITAADVNKIVILKNVVFAEDTPASGNFTGTITPEVVTYAEGDEAAATTINFRNSFSTASVPAGTYDVKAAVALYNTTVQAYPIEYTESTTTGIEGIVVDENAPVEYFNLQGVRVANPENGLYIRRQGNQATKVLVK